jgi:hypothetical protein
VFGYLKKGQQEDFCSFLGSHPRGGKDALDMDYNEELKAQYGDANEEDDTVNPIPLVNEMEITVFVYSHCTHDQTTSKLITLDEAQCYTSISGTAGSTF